MAGEETVILSLSPRRRRSDPPTGTSGDLGFSLTIYRGAVRHATAAALDELEPLLSQLRQLNGLVEKKRGVFYRRSRAFLHFHEDPAGLHADVRLTTDFERFRVQSVKEQSELLKRVNRCLSGHAM